MLKKTILAVILILVVLHFAGCNTVQGVGRDISWTGRAGAEAIDKIIYPPHKNQQPQITYENY